MPLFDILTRKENQTTSNRASDVRCFDCALYALCARGGSTLVGSFMKNSNDNFIQLIENGKRYHHRLPPSKITWMPQGGDVDTFASTSTSLRLWKTSDEKPVLKLYPSNKAGSNVPCPLTSLSWNSCNLAKVATSAVDTTISIWDVEKSKLETQLIAHDKAVLDVSFGNSMHQFVSVSEDGSLRLFDSRDLDHSTILYEDSVPLLRVNWFDSLSFPNLIATLAADRSDIMMFDIRKSGFVVGVLRLSPVVANAIAWSQSGNLAGALSDGKIAVWSSIFEATQTSGDIIKLRPDKVLSTVPSYTEGGITNIAWTESGITAVHGTNVCMNIPVN
jgi:WD40 repeat protein